MIDKIHAAYKKPVVSSLALHAAVFLALLVGVLSSTVAPEHYTETPVVQASLVSRQGLDAPSPVTNAPPSKIPAKAIVKTPLPPVEPTKPQATPASPAKPAPTLEKPTPASHDKHKTEKPLPKKTEKAVKQVVVKKTITQKTETKKAATSKAAAQHAAAVQAEAKARAAQAAAKAAHAQQVAGIVDKYRARILSAISEQWAIPSSADKSMDLQLAVQLNARGEVLDVQLLRSSHNTPLDRSAIAAVYKASPLPVPQDPEAFAPFKRLVVTVRPEEIVN